MPITNFEVEEQPVLSKPEDAPARTELDALQKVMLIAHAADSLRASDIVILDLRGLTIIADFFLICTGNSSIQIRAISDRIEERMHEAGYRKLRVEGYQEATWILMDYSEVVVHVMAAEQRAFYNLEGFWADAPRLEIDLTPEQGARPARAQFEPPEV
jgi:ribosome-associated protein